MASFFAKRCLQKYLNIFFYNGRISPADMVNLIVSEIDGKIYERKAVVVVGYSRGLARSVMRVSSDGVPSRKAKPGHSPVPLLT